VQSVQCAAGILATTALSAYEYVLRQSLEDFLFVRRFRQLRQRMMAAAQAQATFTDEDVFNRVS
jgi:hypothetical protein